MGTSRNSTCRRSPGRPYPTREAAEQGILDRRINRLTAQDRDPGYQVKGCDCGGFHIFSAAQLAERSRKVLRKAANREPRGGRR